MTTLNKEKAVVLGRYVVADPAICHGALTFRGTRIFVADVLEQISDDVEWDVIIEEWHGSITKAAISEAVHLARKALLAEYPPPSVPRS